MCKSAALAVETVAAAVAIYHKRSKKQENVLKKERNDCKTVAPAIETVAAAVAIYRKRSKKQQNASKKRRIECKTVAPGPQTVAAAGAARRLAGRARRAATAVYGVGGRGGVQGCVHGCTRQSKKDGD